MVYIGVLVTVYTVGPMPLTVQLAVRRKRCVSRSHSGECDFFFAMRLASCLNQVNMAVTSNGWKCEAIIVVNQTSEQDNLLISNRA